MLVPTYATFRPVQIKTLARYLRLLLFVFALSSNALPQAAPSQAAGQAGSDDPTPNLPPVKTTVTVNETLSSEAPAAITTLTHQQLQTIPGLEMDDRLRQVPGFSLFRRS